MDTAIISLNLDTTDPEAKLGFEFWVDDTLVHDIEHVTGPQRLEHHLEEGASDEQAQHQLRLVLKNKTWDHTQVDEAGNIIKDARLEISDVRFDDIELGQVFIDLAKYYHQNNIEDGEKIVDNFYKDMGCNGCVVLEFSTPIYLWLLESM